MRYVIARAMLIMVWLGRTPWCLPGAGSGQGSPGAEVVAQVAHTDRSRLLPTLFGFGDGMVGQREVQVEAAPRIQDERGGGVVTDSQEPRAL